VESGRGGERFSWRIDFVYSFTLETIPRCQQLHIQLQKEIIVLCLIMLEEEQIPRSQNYQDSFQNLIEYNKTLHMFKEDVVK